MRRALQRVRIAGRGSPAQHVEPGIGLFEKAGDDARHDQQQYEQGYLPMVSSSCTTEFARTDQVT